MMRERPRADPATTEPRPSKKTSSKPSRSYSALTRSQRACSRQLSAGIAIMSRRKRTRSASYRRAAAIAAVPVVLVMLVASFPTSPRTPDARRPG